MCFSTSPSMANLRTMGKLLRALLRREGHRDEGELLCFKQGGSISGSRGLAPSPLPPFLRKKEELQGFHNLARQWHRRQFHLWRTYSPTWSVRIYRTTRGSSQRPMRSPNFQRTIQKGSPTPTHTPADRSSSSASSGTPGFHVFKAIESVGSHGGTTSKVVKIVDCGEHSYTLSAASTAAESLI